MTPKRKRKHVSLKPVNDNGRQSWILIDPQGDSIVGFSLYMRHLIKKCRALHTRRSYALALSQFFDYLYEVALLNDGLTEQLLEDACEAYEVYMIRGEKADENLSIEVAKSLPSPKLKPSSYDVHHSAVQGFFRQSGKFAKRMKQLQDAGFKTGMTKDASAIPLFETEQRDLDYRERTAIIYNSVLASTISGGAQVTNANILERRFSSKQDTDSVFNDEETDEKEFPWDRFQDLLDAAPSLRERTFWALLGATGCRYSEGLQVLWQDISLENREIKIINPKSRIDIYDTVPPEQLESLVFKARATRQTFIISPWGPQFFKYLLKYMRSDDYRLGVSHDFIFQSKHKPTFGEPYRFNSYQGMLQIFKQTVAKVLGTDENYGFHSIRHMYGFYLKNDAPRADGSKGFQLSEVQAYMGHEDIKTTRKYARSEKQRLKMQLTYANQAQMGAYGPRSMLEIRLEHNRKEHEDLLKQQVLLESIKKVSKND